MEGMESEKSKFETDNDETFTAKFVEAAREYYLNDFPNPNREDCPPSDLLSKVASSGTLPDEDLRRHLLDCSPCLKDFRAFRKSEIVPAGSAAKVSWFDFFRQPIFAIGLCLLVCGLFGALIYILVVPKDAEIAKQNPTIETNKTAEIAESKASDLPENAAIPVIVNKTVEKNVNKPIKKETPQPTEKPKSSTTKTFNLDVSKTTVLRGQSARQTIYSLPNQNVDLNIKLFENSPASDYEISLLDAFGKPLVKSRSIYSNGKAVKTRMDLTNQTGKVRLCVAPVNEVPDCFLINIVDEK